MAASVAAVRWRRQHRQSAAVAATARVVVELADQMWGRGGAVVVGAGGVRLRVAAVCSSATLLVPRFLCSASSLPSAHFAPKLLSMRLPIARASFGDKRGRWMAPVRTLVALGLLAVELVAQARLNHRGPTSSCCSDAASSAHRRRPSSCRGAHWLTGQAHRPLVQPSHVRGGPPGTCIRPTGAVMPSRPADGR